MKHFRIRWVGRNVPTTWLPRFPDITPLDFLWGYIKNRVYAAPVAVCDELRARIQAVVGTVTEGMFQNTSLEVEYR